MNEALPEVAVSPDLAGPLLGAAASKLQSWQATLIGQGGRMTDVDYRTYLADLRAIAGTCLSLVDAEGQ